MLKNSQVTLFRLNVPKSIHTVAKRCKNLVVLDNKSRWNADGTPQSDEFIDHLIKPYTDEDQAFLNELITVTSPLRISRVMRVRRVQKDCLVLDYGEASNFSVKFSLSNGECLSVGQGWEGFSLSAASIAEYLHRTKDSAEELDEEEVV